MPEIVWIAQVLSFDDECYEFTEGCDTYRVRPVDVQTAYTDENTRDMSEIDLPAGAELDALLAENLFGWTRDPNRCERCGWPLAKSLDDGCIPSVCRYIGDVERRYDEPWPWSADQSGVGDILAAMLAKGYVPTIRRLDDGRINAFMATRENRHGEATSYTLAHAVCLAAARALSIATETT